MSGFKLVQVRAECGRTRAQEAVEWGMSEGQA